LGRAGLPCGRLLDFAEYWMSFSEQIWRFLDTAVQNQASPDSPVEPAVARCARGAWQSGVGNCCSDQISTHAKDA